MDKINILGLMNELNVQSLSSVELYGRVVSELQRPSYMTDKIIPKVGGMYVKMEVFAVRLPFYHEKLSDMGLVEDLDLYMVNGSVALYIDESMRLELPDWYAVKGSLMRTRDEVHGGSNVLNLFSLRKRTKTWDMLFNRLGTLDLNTWDMNSRAAKWISISADEGTFERPADVIEELPRFVAYEGEDADLTVLLKNNREVPFVKVESELEDMGSQELFKKSVGALPGDLDKWILELDLAKQKKRRFLNGLYTKYSIKDSDGCNPEYLALISRLYAELKVKPSKYELSGEKVFSKYLNSFGAVAASRNRYGVSSAEDILSNIQDVRGYIEGSKMMVRSLEGASWALCKTAFEDPDIAFVGLLLVMGGLETESFVANIQDSIASGLDAVQVLVKDPYALALLHIITFEQAEFFALCFDSYNESLREVAMLDSYVHNSATGATVYLCQAVTKVGVENTVLNSRYFTRISSTLAHYIGRSSVSGEQKDVRHISTLNLNKVINMYTSWGFGALLNIQGTEFLTSYLFLYKELNIMQAMQKRGNAVSEDAELLEKDNFLNDCLAAYEAEEGIKLEEKQIEGARALLLKGAIVTGCAGSGKTEIIKLWIFILERLRVIKRILTLEVSDCFDNEVDGVWENLPRLSLVAPASKAAKHLQSVIGRDDVIVKTVHSTYSLRDVIDSSILLDTEKEKKDDDNFYSCDFCIIEEAAMSTLDLLYSVVSHLNENIPIYLVGDAEQLPPIGKGKPFVDALTYLPCVRLTVSKRAIEGSKITENGVLINGASEPKFWKPLNSENDFRLGYCETNKELVGDIKDLCSYFLSGLAPAESTANPFGKYGIPESEIPRLRGLLPDDIQVITPYATDNSEWGAPKLNKVLQPVFNKINGRDNTFFLGGSIRTATKFLKNDRVLNSVNNYDVRWYGDRDVQCGEFDCLDKAGVMNGEVGTFIGLRSSLDTVLVPSASDRERGLFIRNKRDDKSRKMSRAESEWKRMQSRVRNDSKYTDSQDYFAIVSYPNYNNRGVHYILYPCKRQGYNRGIDDQVGYTFTGSELNNLSLFYAGTIHKMQGSQARVVLIAWGNIPYETYFLNRNMLYTAVTRGEEYVMLLGSTHNSASSQVSKARKLAANDSNTSITELICC